MAGNLPVPNVAQVRLVWAKNGIPWAVNLLHFGHDAGASMSQSKADGIATLIKAAFTSSGLGSVISTLVTLDRVETRHMDAGTDPWFIGAGAPVPGTAAGHLLPDATAFTVTLKTAKRGRSYTGRTYLYGFTEDANQANGTITDAAKQDAVDFLTVVQDNMENNQQLDLCIVSRWFTPPNSPPNTPAVERNPPTHENVTQIVALDSRWDTQRRRATPGI